MIFNHKLYFFSKIIYSIYVFTFILTFLARGCFCNPAKIQRLYMVRPSGPKISINTRGNQCLCPPTRTCRHPTSQSRSSRWENPTVTTAGLFIWRDSMPNASSIYFPLKKSRSVINGQMSLYTILKAKDNLFLHKVGGHRLPPTFSNGNNYNDASSYLKIVELLTFLCLYVPLSNNNLGDILNPITCFVQLFSLQYS